MRWLKATPQTRIERTIPERPLLHACSGNDAGFGDVTLDAECAADVQGDVRQLPFRDDSFAAAYADPPWIAAFKRDVAAMMRELLRVASVVYVLSPWTYGSSSCRLTDVSVAWQPGVQQALTFCRYERSAA